MNANLADTEALLDLLTELFGLESTTVTARVLTSNGIHSFINFCQEVSQRSSKIQQETKP